MIAVFLSPVYILVNIYLIRWLFRWLKAVHPCLGKRRVKILISVIYLFFASALLAGFLMPAVYEQSYVMHLSNYCVGVRTCVIQTVGAVCICCYYSK